MPTTPRHAFQKWSAGFTQSDTLLNTDLDMLDVRVGLSVRSRTENAPLGGDVAGDCYIINATPSGAFSTFTQHYVAWYNGTTWYEFSPVTGQVSWVEDDADGVIFSGASWVVTIGGSEFADDLFRIQDNGDLTKQIAFQASGVGAGQTRTITMPNSDVNLGHVAGISAPIHTLHVETVANIDYVLTFDAPYAGTITTLRAKTESGTCTVTGAINGTPLGGTACSAATTADEEAHASANAYAKGAEIKITVSSNSAAVDLEVTFYGTRTDL